MDFDSDCAFGELDYDFDFCFVGYENSSGFCYGLSPEMNDLGYWMMDFGFCFDFFHVHGFCFGSDHPHLLHERV